MKPLSQIPRRLGPFRIECKWQPEVLVPHEAIAHEMFDEAKPWDEITVGTIDGKICRPTFLMTWCEPKEEWLDDICESRWGCKFAAMRSMWYERLKVRYGMKTWHLIKLDELG